MGSLKIQLFRGVCGTRAKLETLETPMVGADRPLLFMRDIIVYV